MKIAILSRNKRLYSTRRLVEAGEAAGHEMHVIDTLRCYIETKGACRVYSGTRTPIAVNYSCK
jgi:glutathione synthase/RimK-type ligase-like ATP-grasp enzyme